MYIYVILAHFCMALASCGKHMLCIFTVLKLNLLSWDDLWEIIVMHIYVILAQFA